MIKNAKTIKEMLSKVLNIWKRELIIIKIITLSFLLLIVKMRFFSKYHGLRIENITEWKSKISQIKINWNLLYKIEGG